MEFVIGLLGVAAAIAIPVYLQRKEHPKRELRYAVTFMPQSARYSREQSFDVRLLVWSASRADIPSALFDAGSPVVFRFSCEIGYPGGAPPHPERGSLRLKSPTDVILEPHLIRPDFATAVVLTATGPFDVSVQNSLIDIPVVRDFAAERPNMSDQQRAVTRSKARAHVSLLAVSLWVTIASFVLFAVGIGVSFADVGVGGSIGIPGMLGLPVGIILLITSGLRRLLNRRQSRRPAPVTLSP